MIILGVILLVAGFFLNLSFLSALGAVVLVIGLALTLMGALGHAIGGRRTYY
jgi:hypothetical protein